MSAVLDAWRERGQHAEVLGQSEVELTVTIPV